jgi:1-aminocyclopropane-1-carboxylate deaminase/D-cysteine desulfhydrase-like pyridoxal-dependent ACC family enzyme
VKRDDLTHPVYGGNKVRKLAALLEDAQHEGATRIVTIGGVGSHHVLATGVFGKRVGLEVEAVVLRQPCSAHVLETVRASIGQGVRLHPATSYSDALRRFADIVASGAYAVPPGGSSRIGTLGVVGAAHELAQQMRAGELPEPDLIVVPLGSGGTVAGLLAGLAETTLRTRVLAVAVTEPQKLFESKARALAQELVDQALRPRVAQRLEVERRYLGSGYGRATPAGHHAMRQAARVGLTLDQAYTAKAFAAALDRVALGAERNVLFWHTLSGASLAPLLVGAPTESELDPALRQLAYD